MLQPKPLERKLASHGCKNNNIHDRKQRIHTSKIKIKTREIEYTNSLALPQFFLASSSRSAKSFNPSCLRFTSGMRWMENMIRVRWKRMVEWMMSPPDGCLLPYITKFVTWGTIRQNLKVDRAKIARNQHKICQRYGWCGPGYGLGRPHSRLRYEERWSSCGSGRLHLYPQKLSDSIGSDEVCGLGCGQG